MLPNSDDAANTFLLDMPGAGVLNAAQSFGTFSNLPEKFHDSFSTAFNTILNFAKDFDRKKWSSRADFFREGFSAVAASLVIYSCTTGGGLNASLGLFVSLLLTAVWDGSDVVSALLIAPEYFKTAKENPTKTNKFIAWSNIIYYPFVLGVFTTWAAYTIIRDADERCSTPSSENCFQDVLLKSAKTEGDPTILAINNFAYGGGALLAAIYQILLKKSEDNIYKHTAEVTGNLTCFIGAMFGALSMLLDPKFYVYISAAFYAMYAMLKETLLLLSSPKVETMSARLFHPTDKNIPTSDKPAINGDPVDSAATYIQVK